MYGLNLAERGDIGLCTVDAVLLFVMLLKFIIGLVLNAVGELVGDIGTLLSSCSVAGSNGEDACC